MEKILISACLVGDKTTYKGTNNKIDLIDKLLERYDLVPFCPEVEGGLKVPRAPSEINSKGKVINKKGIDVTDNFLKGARNALNICRFLDIKIAILKENSPSCGVHNIYDGTFTSKLKSGEGITTKLLKDNGVQVYNENEISILLEENNQ